MGLVVHFDGLCQPKNPGGVATYGFVVREGPKLLHEECGLAAEPWTPGATNNVAEYAGVVKALEWLEARGATGETIVVRGDSDLVVKQLRGEYKVKAPLLVGLFGRARDLARKFPKLRFEWIPREENGEADALTNRAYAEFLAKGRPARGRGDGELRATRGFRLDLDLPAPASAAWRLLPSPGFLRDAFGAGSRIERRKGGRARLGGDFEVEDLAPNRYLLLGSAEGLRVNLTLLPLTDGTLARVEVSGYPATPEGDAARAAAERLWSAALLALQSALEDRGPN